MNAMLPHAIEVTETKITFTRAEWDAYIERLEDEEDLATIRAAEARRAELGDEEYRRLCYTAAEVDRMLDDGVSPLTIWRERAGLSQRQLALQAKTSPGYLSEIEKGRKLGSASVLRRIAAVLNAPMDYLVTDVDHG